MLCSSHLPSLIISLRNNGRLLHLRCLIKTQLYCMLYVKIILILLRHCCRSWINSTLGRPWNELDILFFHDIEAFSDRVIILTVVLNITLRNMVTIKYYNVG